MNTIIAFTDGASKGNPGPGGWGAVLVHGDHIEELGGFEKKTTNNRMEMLAALGVVTYANSKRAKLTIYTDSSYLVNGITKWVHGWQAKGWKTATGGQVLNQDIWEDLVKYSKDIDINWKIVGGHIGIPGNERADSIASDMAEEKEVTLYRGTMSDYTINIMNFSSDQKSVEAKREMKAKKNSGKAYSYLSMIKDDIKTHKTWAECEARVKGMSGAKYRKALSPEDEKSIINSWRVGKK